MRSPLPRHQNIDGGTAAFQRILGGLFIAGMWLLIIKQRAQPVIKICVAKREMAHRISVGVGQRICGTNPRHDVLSNRAQIRANWNRDANHRHDAARRNSLRD